MTLLEKIKNITWWTLDIKLKDILTELFATTEGIDTRVTNIENTSSVDSRPYKVYTALVDQTGTNAPTVVVLENTLGGTIVWTRVAAGIYSGTLTGAFPLDKTFTIIGGNYLSPLHFLRSVRNTDDIIGIIVNNNAGTSVDNILKKTSLEIRVYN